MIFVLIVAAVAGSYFALSVIKVNDYVYGTGLITTPERCRIFPADKGAIRAVLAVDGQRVKKGDVLVELEDSDQVSLIERRKAEVELAEAKVQRQQSVNTEILRKREDSLKIARVVLENARTEYERAVNLGTAMAREESERRKLDFDLAAARYEAEQNATCDSLDKEVAELQKSVEVARKLLDEAEKMLEKRKVISPIDGVLSLSLLAIGEIIDPSRTLGEVFDDSAFIVRVRVSERHLHKLARKQPASASLTSYPHDLYGYFPGHVLDTSKIVTPQSTGEGFYVVEVILDNSKAALMPGGSADVRITVGRTSLFKRLVSIN